MQSNVNEQGQPVQQQGHNTYILQDDYALQIHQLWKSNADFSTIIDTILSNENYFNIKSALLPNLETQIELYLTNMQQNNVLTVMEELMHQQMVSSIN
jgi:tagaturonate reductase